MPSRLFLRISLAFAPLLAFLSAVLPLPSFPPPPPATDVATTRHRSSCSSQVDARGCYCALSAAFLTGILTPELKASPDHARLML
eukprot:601048-Hanusia_phi.AAC.1